MREELARRPLARNWLLRTAQGSLLLLADHHQMPVLPEAGLVQLAQALQRGLGTGLRATPQPHDALLSAVAHANPFGSEVLLCGARFDFTGAAAAQVDQQLACRLHCGASAIWFSHCESLVAAGAAPPPCMEMNRLRPPAGSSPRTAM